LKPTKFGSFRAVTKFPGSSEQAGVRPPGFPRGGRSASKGTRKSPAVAVVQLHGSRLDWRRPCARTTAHFWLSPQRPGCSRPGAVRPPFLAISRLRIPDRL